MILTTSWFNFNFKTDFLFLVLHYYTLTLKFQTKKAIMPVRLVVTRFVFLTANVLRCWCPCYRPHRKQVRGFLIAPKLFPCRKSKIMVMKFSTPFKKWQMVGSACRIVVNAASLKCRMCVQNGKARENSPPSFLRCSSNRAHTVKSRFVYYFQARFVRNPF